MTSRPRWSRRRTATRLFLGAVAGLGMTATPAVGLDAPNVPTVYASAELSGPTITSFSAVAGPGGTVTFSGTATDDESLEGCLVVIEGPGIYATAVIVNGAFSTTVSGVFGLDPITVTAVVIDADGNTSDEVSETFMPTGSTGGGGGGPRHSLGGGPPPPPPPGGP